MLEEYLQKSKKLFAFNPDKAIQNTLPLENRVICFNTSDIDVEISQRYDIGTKTYSVYGTIAGKRRFDPDSKLEAVNSYFFENQYAINQSIVKILSKEKIPADASESGLYFGNGRSISTNGIWMIYHTNHYDFSLDGKFKDLIKEEIDISSRSFSVIYGVMHYVIQQIPDIDIFNKFPQKKDLTQFEESNIVNKYLNRSITDRCNGLFFMGVGMIGSAEKSVQQGYLDGAMQVKKNNVV